MDNENPEQLADIILRAYNNPGQLENRGVQGQEYCLNNFSWEKTVKIIANTILNDKQIANSQLLIVNHDKLAKYAVAGIGRRDTLRWEKSLEKELSP